MKVQKVMGKLWETFTNFLNIFKKKIKKFPKILKFKNKKSGKSPPLCNPNGKPFANLTDICQIFMEYLLISHILIIEWIILHVMSHMMK